MEDGIPPPDQIGYKALLQTLNRLNCDIVAFQGLRRRSSDNLHELAKDAGYPYVVESSGGDFSGGFLVGYISRFPVIRENEITSPKKGREFSRYPLVTEFDKPGSTNDLVLVNVQYKASLSYASAFRRALEAKRTIEYLNKQYPNEPFLFVMGNFNDDMQRDQVKNFTKEPPFMPKKYKVGRDVKYPIPYAVYPRTVFEKAGLAVCEALHTGQSIDVTCPRSRYRFDFILPRKVLVDEGAVQQEVYNSANDAPDTGLDKKGDPLPERVSSAVSDHLMVFADVNIP
jgi:hypothetical protein